MIYYKTEEEIELIRVSSLLVSKTLAEIARAIKPGITTLKLDKLAEEMIKDNKGVPAFKNYKGFPNSICASPNEQVVHGIPDKKPLKSGDIISIDCGVYKNGYFGDSAFTFAVGEVKPDILQLMQITIESLYLGIAQAVAGKRLGDVSHAIQELAEKKHGYGIVRELVGHGIGKSLHEGPEVPNYGKRGSGIKLQEGLTLAIEPMINLGSRQIEQSSDGWTIVTADRKPSAHYEHTIVVRKGEAELLSTFEEIEEAVKSNIEIQEINFKI